MPPAALPGTPINAPVLPARPSNPSAANGPGSAVQQSNVPAAMNGGPSTRSSAATPSSADGTAHPAVDALVPAAGSEAGAATREADAGVAAEASDSAADLAAAGEAAASTSGSPGFDFDSAAQARLTDILSDYQGTHNFHNFTIRMSANDPSAKRYILSFRCEGVQMIEVTFQACEARPVGKSFWPTISAFPLPALACGSQIISMLAC